MGLRGSFIVPKAIMLESQNVGASVREPHCYWQFIIIKITIIGIIKSEFVVDYLYSCLVWVTTTIGYAIIGISYFIIGIITSSSFTRPSFLLWFKNILINI